MTNSSASEYRIWTFNKQENKMDVSCNGIKIFDMDLDVYPYSNDEDCKSEWSRNFAHIKFVHQSNLTDTASDYMRNCEYGKFIT